MRNESILLLEDDKNYLKLYQEILTKDFDCIPFSNASDALTFLSSHKPKSIVLDLNLPDMNGIEFCEKLKSTNDLDDIDIIFVSGDSAPEVKLKAFEVGASDFLVKPFEIQELQFKIRKSVDRQIKKDALFKEVLDSRDVIYNAMEQASQYSVVMNFFKHLSQCKSTQNIANVFFNTMSQFKLQCSLRISLPTLCYFRTDQEDVTPIEKDIFELLVNRGRIFPFSNRLIINDKHVSFIIKNPPQDESELGQVRDYVAAMIEGLEAKVIELYSQIGMNSAIEDLNGNIHELKDGIKAHNQTINSVMSNMIMEIAGSYHELEMTETQESFLNALIEKSTEQLSSAETQLVQIMTNLENIKDNMETVQVAVSDDGTQSTSSVDDIELF